MLAKLPFKGTLLNTFTVIVGSLIGLALGRAVPSAWQDVVQAGIGLVVLGVGIQMFLKTKNVLIVVASIALGAILGLALGITPALENVAESFRKLLNSEGSFNLGFITASVLYCVGPMTLLGCMQDGIEGKSELLQLKSLLDGITSIFFAASMGFGVLASAATVLVVQGLLTVLARFLKPIASSPAAIDEASATGGVIMLAIGLGLTQIKSIPAETFLPALFLAPATVLIAARFKKTETSKTEKAVQFSDGP